MSIDPRKPLLQAAVEAILWPLARLCVAHGLLFAQVEELFKRAYVRAAREARMQAGVATTRDVSQVSLATGINRREVTRLSADIEPERVQRPSPATQVFLRWISDGRLHREHGQPLSLPRTGPDPSFETLATSITTHVHPRSLLDELCRLELAALSEDGETVTLLTDHFVPSRDDERLFAFLGGNVGDHLAAAAANVIHRDRRHFEQALFTDGLSEQSALVVRQLAQAQWAALSAAIVPALERLIDDDHQHQRPLTRRARIGLFSFHESLEEPSHEPSDDSPSR